MSDLFVDGSISRRALLVGGAAAVATAALWGSEGAPRARADTNSDLDLVRTQWFNTLVGNYDQTDSVIAKYVSDSAAAAQPLLAAMNTSSTRTYLWSDLDSSTVSAVQTSAMGRLRTLALALKSPGSTLYGSSSLRSAILSGLDWFLANKYGLTVHSYDNWWDWQIGIPLALNDVCVLMYADLSSAQIATAMGAIAHYAPSPTVTNGGTSTGANRNWACAIAIVRGALSRDGATIAAAKNAAADLFAYTTTGDGFYADGGFIQHQNFAYTGGYGASLLQYLTYSMIACAGTQWAFTSARLTQIYNWVQENYVPWMHTGAIMDMTRGRTLSRFYETDHRTGRLIIATLLQLAAVLPTAQAQTVLSQCKGWIAANTYLPFFTFDPVPVEQVRVSSIAKGRALVSNTAIATAAETTGSRVATSMARAVHRRPGFAYAIAMDTSTIKPYESINHENLQGWYTGEGSVYLYLPGKPGHWPNGYWPTANKYRIPGTTIDAKTLSPGVRRGSTNTWAGGAVLDEAAAIGMGLSFGVQTLTGKKSWLCIGDAIVCLGAAISSTDGHTIETIIEQRNVGQNGNTVPVFDGAAVLATASSTPTAFTPRWVWIPDTCGYVFPSGSSIKAIREDRTGKWTDMDQRGVYDDTATYSRRFITMWFDHGVSPTNASYVYVQLPGATQAQTSAAAAADLGVVANTGLVQAATRDGFTAANFWSASAPKTAGIQVSAPVSVVVNRNNGKLAVAVSDPTQLLTGSVTVTLDDKAGGLISADSGVTVVQTSPQLKLSIAIAGSGGKTFTARFGAAS